MQNLHEAFMESLVLQGALAVMVVGTMCWLYANGQEVPDGLIGLSGLVVGYYFRTKAIAETKKQLPNKEG